MNKIYCIYKLPHELFCDGSCLGKAVEIEIENIAGLLYMPNVCDNKTDKNGGEPYLVCPINDEIWLKFDENNNRYNEWGRITSYYDYLAEVSQVMIIFENKTKEDLQVIYNHIDEWFRRVYNIITIKTGTSCFFSPLKIDQVSPSLDFYGLESDRLSRIHVNNENIASMSIIIRDKGLSIKQFQEIAQKANEGKCITFEYDRYLEAIHSFDKGDYKGVIVNCSIAIERAIVQEIKKICKSKGISSSKLLEKFKMLGGIFSLAEALKISLPTTDYRSDINEVRNNVVHRGLEPNEKQTRKFLKDTKLYLERFSTMFEL